MNLTSTHSDSQLSPTGPIQRESLREQLQIQTQKCIKCKLCRKECKFLKKYGHPKTIAENFDPTSNDSLMMAFECSLCKLCAAVCPVKIDPGAMFLEMRREAVERGIQDLSDYGVILGYEKRGTSKGYSYYGLPANCETVLFPGCTLPGTRPEKVKSLYTHLQKSIPSLGIVLDCCTKPSHDLGRDTHFQEMFSEMKEYLLDQGIKSVLVACPNCYRVFKEYGSPLQVKTVYEHMDETSIPEAADISAKVTIHDPCGTRTEKSVQTTIRRLAKHKHLEVEEMKHTGPKTLCCGEGGSVGCIAPDYSKNWGRLRQQEADGTRILTYCAGCANFLDSLNPTSHIVDLLFEPEKTLAGKTKVSKAPWTYLNRIRLKKYFQKHANSTVSRERTFTGENASKGGTYKRILFLAALIGIITAVQMSGLTQYLEQDKLRAFIEGYGVLAPIVYMLTYTVAPALFLPGLPITIVGGILFGPFWGVVYSITSATAGACVAFLISRYIGREWIEGKLRNPRWKQLDIMVEEHGWKAVAFTRLIPIFPFNLLNYAFGMTKVKFLHYAVTSFICMLPACIAFIVFSSSLLEVIKGNITPEFIVGIVLILAVSMIPFFYNKLKKKEKKKLTKKADPCSYNLKKSLKVKAIIFIVLSCLVLSGILLVKRYFYILDAYVYTWEFHLLFALNNIKKANLELYAEYLQSMGPVKSFSFLFLGHIVQSLYFSLSNQILPVASTIAFGLAPAFFVNLLSLMALGTVSYGAGTFLLGDIIPVLCGDRYFLFKNKMNSLPAALIPISCAFPLLSIPVVGITSSLFKISYFRTMLFFGCGLVLRILWLSIFWQ